MKMTLLLSLLITLFSVGCLQAADNTSLSSPDDRALVSSSGDEPDYATVFPDDTVSRIDITLSSENWQAMLTNMTELYGEFGNTSRMQMGGNGTPPQGREPGSTGGMKMPGERGGNLDTNPIWVPATISLNGTTLDNVGIRFKGFSSLSGSWRDGTYKISLKVDCDKFEDEYPEIKNQKIYGFDEFSLQSGYGDSSLIKDKVVPEIFRIAGVPAPRTAFYQVFIDTGSGPEYFGVYTLIEGVEDTMLSTQFSDDSGNLYKPQGERSATFEAGTFNESIFEKKTNKKENDYTDLQKLYTALNDESRTTDPASWRAGLEAVLDVDEFITWLATNTVIQNWDTYGSMAHNFYLYTNPETGLITWIPWDNNFALQNGTGMGGMNGEAPPGFGNFSPGAMPGAEQQMQIPPGFEPQSGANRTMADRRGPGSQQNLSLSGVGEEWPLIRYLMDDPVYHEQYVTAVSMVIDEAFVPEKMEALYTRYHNLISPYVVGEDGERTGYTHLKDPQNFIDSLDTLISHASSRYDAVVEFLQEQRGNSS